ncbi:LuxR C-terminal-related transcriptional regulator [Polaribacter vadi]|uniref:helix-turn-helix transcriptional regulator n=1 Tax=Polaribacter TaxID=52959 RepID=UPI001C0A3E8E|nr:MULTISPECIES: LuxR family transcriptional regulator [Polaribacter]MBU3013082.1 LuxR C-terminal-related transcriptional regulator [Polaribacter vadi]MDO6742901.1 LuxR C-terminal-related transcriptional regulator [Polaribacter sp. 1_MG-2023]
MAHKKDFFSFQNSVTSISSKENLQSPFYLESIQAFARLSNNSIYIIDYKEKGFEYVSDNPLLLCGNSAKEVKEMGYNFYLKHVVKKDLELLLKVNQIGFDFYETIPLEDRKDYSISYDFHLINQEAKKTLVNHRLTPLFLTDEGKIWKALCLVSLSSSNDSGNIKMYKKGNQKFLEYNEEKKHWHSVKTIQLSKREKEILHLSIRGLTINEIAEEIVISNNTVKFHRKKLFEKLDVSNITEAISYAKNNFLI